MTQIKEALSVIAIAAAIVFAAWLLSRRSRSTDDSTSRQQLLRMCLGDRALMKRLLEREVARHPGISHRKAVARAIDSMGRNGSGTRLKGLDEMPVPPMTLRQRYFRIRSMWLRSNLPEYLEHILKFGLVLVVFYGVAKLMGFEAHAGRGGFP